MAPDAGEDVWFIGSAVSSRKRVLREECMGRGNQAALFCPPADREIIYSGSGEKTSG